jgi:hypothetical protein
MVFLQGSDAGDRDVRGFEVLVPDAVIPETLRVKLLKGMLHAKLFSFAPYDGLLISQRNPHKSVSQSDPEFTVAIWEVEKYIQYYAKPERQNIVLVQVCLEWLFDRVIDLELNTDIVLPKILRVLQEVGTLVGYTESIRNLIAEEVADDSDDDSVQGVASQTNSDDSMASASVSISDFDRYYMIQKEELIKALWHWAFQSKCTMQ